MNYFPWKSHSEKKKLTYISEYKHNYERILSKNSAFVSLVVKFKPHTKKSFKKRWRGASWTESIALGEERKENKKERNENTYEWEEPACACAYLRVRVCVRVCVMGGRKWVQGGDASAIIVIVRKWKVRGTKKKKKYEGGGGDVEWQTEVMEEGGGRGERNKIGEKTNEGEGWKGMIWKAEVSELLWIEGMTMIL